MGMSCGICAAKRPVPRNNSLLVPGTENWVNVPQHSMSTIKAKPQVATQEAKKEEQDLDKHMEKYVAMSPEEMKALMSHEDHEAQKHANIGNTLARYHGHARSGLPCQDEDSNCAELAHAGLCTTRPQHTLRKCRQSCGMCSHDCGDLDPKCPRLAEKGQCTKDPIGVLAKCPHSCNMCYDQSEDVEFHLERHCFDADEELCPVWADIGKCDRDPMSLKMCRKSCNMCSIKERTIVCKDNDDDHCAGWAKSGQCSESILTMRTC